MNPRPKRIVIVDDSDAACAMFRDILIERYGSGVDVETYVTPLNALSRIDASIDLLVVDLEMPHIDGRKFLEFAIEKGVSRARVIVTSGRDAEDLHSIFPAGSCLAVMNKTEPKQREAFTMILDSIMRR